MYSVFQKMTILKNGRTPLDLLASLAQLYRDELDFVTEEEFQALLQNLQTEFFLKYFEDEKELKRFKSYIEGKLKTVKHVPIVLFSNSAQKIDQDGIFMLAQASSNLLTYKNHKFFLQVRLDIDLTTEQEKEAMKRKAGLEAIGSEMVASKTGGEDRFKPSPDQWAKWEKEAADIKARKPMKTVNGRKKWICEYDACEGTFTTWPSLEKHIKSKHYNFAEFDCPFCPEPSVFTRDASLTYHLLCHMNIHLFRCDECHELFRHKNHFLDHLKGHGKTQTIVPVKDVNGLIRLGFEIFNKDGDKDQVVCARDIFQWLRYVNGQGPKPSPPLPGKYSQGKTRQRQKSKPHKRGAKDVSYSSPSFEAPTSMVQQANRMPDIPQENRLSMASTAPRPKAPQQAVKVPQQIYNTKRENKENVAPSAKRFLATNQPLEQQECQGVQGVQVVERRRRSAEPSHVLYPGNYTFPSRVMVTLPPANAWNQSQAYGMMQQQQNVLHYESYIHIPPVYVEAETSPVGPEIHRPWVGTTDEPIIQSGIQHEVQSGFSVQQSQISVPERPINTYINCNGINISNPFSNRRSL